MRLDYSHLLIYGSGLALVSANSIPTTGGLRRLPFSHADDRLIQIKFDDPKSEPADLIGYGLDIWKRDNQKQQILARIPQADENEYPSEIREKLLNSLKNYSFKELDINIDDLVNEMFTSSRLSDDESYDYNVYHDLDEIYSWMDDISTEFGDKVEVSTFGKSYEDRDLKMMTINGKQANQNNAIFVDCGIHAREWIAHAWCQHLVNYLLNNPEGDDQITQISEGLTWYIIPVLNPDGYDYTWKSNRMWRKNRNDQKRCMGVDLNRNYASNWGGPGSSSDACSDSYRGAGPFSEPESTAHSNLIMDLQKNTDNKIQAYLTFHSYSQLVIFPYGKDFTSVPSNYDELSALGQATVKAIKDVNGLDYITGQTTETLYPAAGGSDDWALDDGPVRLSYTFELRDTGEYGFKLPEDQIEPTAAEIIEGMKVIAEYVLEI